MSVNWRRLDPTAGTSSYGVSYIIRELDEEDLRQVILRLSGRLVPEGTGRDKLTEWAAYLYQAQLLRFRGVPASDSIRRRFKWATDPSTPALGDHWARQAAKAKAAFAKMAGKEPSPTSAQALSWKLLDKEGDEMDARGLMKALKKYHGKVIGLNTARSYMSGWRSKNKKKGGAE